MAKKANQASTTPPAETPSSPLGAARTLIIGLVAVIVVLGLALILQAINQPAPGAATISGERPDALANSADECVVCHKRTTPGIVEQYGHSSMAGAKVRCQDCHEVKPDYPGATEHEGSYVLATPTTAMCETCHDTEVAQYKASRHALPAYVAMVGSKDFSEAQMTEFQNIPEGQFAPDKLRNALFAIEGPDVTRFACENCHNVGKPGLDGSTGQCQKCHMRHTFSLEQARKPETCNNCHIGPDHPQWEIYFESKHGIAYATDGDNWNWEAEPGTLTVNDFPAPTCATCHFSGFGSSGTTHDAGDRLTWYLFAPISERRPSYQDNAVRMQSVCSECHNKQWIADFYADGDKLVEAINLRVKDSDTVRDDLKNRGLLTDTPFDEPFDFEHYELWHHWGRTAKFGAWMQGADYTQWHGVYEMIKAMSEIETIATEKIEAGQK